jgi:hypothetical protein
MHIMRPRRKMPDQQARAADACQASWPYGAGFLVAAALALH